MIIPKDIPGKNRLRDSKIISLYIEKNLNEANIAKQFNLTQSRISQILKANVDIILSSKNWNKAQRLNFIKRQLDREEVNSIAVSPDKYIDLWRKEFEHEKENSDMRTIVNVYIPSKQEADEKEYLSRVKSVDAES